MKYLIFIFLLIATPVWAYAQVKTFQSLPGLENAGNLTTQQYIDALYVIAIVAASILAVFKLIWAGVQYMLSEVVTSKQKAKQDIQGALLGLLIILGAVTLLSTVNPNLTNIDFLRNADPTRPIQGSNSTPEEPVREPIICPDGKPEDCHDEYGIQNCTCIR